MAGPLNGEHEAKAAKDEGQRSAVASALVALALWVGFYLTGLALVGGLLLVPWAQETYQHTIDFSGWLAGLFAVLVALAFLPRFSASKKEKEAEPLAESEHPELHRFIREMAMRAQIEPPDTIYLTHDANASAFARARWWGRQTRSVGIGLGLLATLDREELASVVLHELGHHHAGHVRLGPWVYRMRAGIGSVLQRLDGSSFWLHLPFIAYGRLFLKTTRGTSRRQELEADQFAARVCGAEATANALSRVHSQDRLWQAYFHSEVLPLLSRGFLPPLMAGFATFRQAVDLRAEVSDELAKIRRTEQQPDIYDTHPTLAVRRSALGASVEEEELPASTCPSLDLLEDVHRAETTALGTILVRGLGEVTPLEWEEATEKVWRPAWQEQVTKFAATFHRFQARHLPELLANAEAALARSLGGVVLLSPGAKRKRLADLAAMWLTVSLLEKGFTIESPVGEPIRATYQGVSIEPFRMVRELEKGTVTAEAWRRRCDELDL